MLDFTVSVTPQD